MAPELSLGMHGRAADKEIAVRRKAAECSPIRPSVGVEEHPQLLGAFQTINLLLPSLFEEQSRQWPDRNGCLMPELVRSSGSTHPRGGRWRL